MSFLKSAQSFLKLTPKRQVSVSFSDHTDCVIQGNISAIVDWEDFSSLSLVFIL